MPKHTTLGSYIGLTGIWINLRCYLRYMYSPRMWLLAFGPAQYLVLSGLADDLRKEIPIRVKTFRRKLDRHAIVVHTRRWNR